MHKFKNKKRIMILAAAALIIIGAAVFGAVRWLLAYRAHHVEPVADSVLSALDLTKADKLMIVAHPDDEIIWAGSHLLDGGYLVVCITNGRNAVRTHEFEEAVKKSGNIPLILEYPDKVNGKRDEWSEVRSGITDDISRIMKLKNWRYIATHNPNGEYGHIHHKMTSEITTEVYNSTGASCPLYYFGKYYKAVKLPEVRDSLIPVADDKLKGKYELGDIYQSQRKVFEKLDHMMPYEMWTEYTSP